MTDLQAVVAQAADHAEAHSTAPSLLLQTQAALGRLAASADAATGGGRKPYRVPPEWADLLGELAYLMFLLADQTGVSVEDTVRRLAADVSRRAAQAQQLRAAEDDERDWL